MKKLFAMPRTDGMVSIVEVHYEPSPPLIAFPPEAAQEDIDAYLAQLEQAALQAALDRTVTAKNEQWAQERAYHAARGKSMPLIEILEAVEIERATVPADRTFRDALEWRSARLEHNMEKCRAIHRGRIRLARAPLFEANDVELRDAELAGDAQKVSEAIARRDALRDAPADPAIDAATTPEQLKAVWPAVLEVTAEAEVGAATLTK